MAMPDVTRECEVFKGLNTKQLRKLASISREQTYEAGEFIFQQGDLARSLYVLGEGEVVLVISATRLRDPGGKAWGIFNVITEGGIFGWSAIVQPHVYTTSARATSRCRCITIDSAQLLELMESESGLGYKVLRGLLEVISSRLVQSRLTLLSERGLGKPAEEH